MKPIKTIGVACPSFRPHTREIRAGMDVLHRAGFEVIAGPIARLGRPQYNTPFHNLDGRVAELIGMLQDPSIDAIWCADGGMGAGYILPRLVPLLCYKPIIGFSDVGYLTTLMTLHGQPCFLAPNCLVDDDNKAEDLQRAADTLAVLCGSGGRLPNDGPFLQTIHPLGEGSILRFGPVPVDVIREGTVNGRFFGGNFSVFASYSLAYLTGMNSFRLENAVLFFEEHGTNAPGEREYLLWQQLQTLQLSGVWKGVGGMITGEIPGGGPYETEQDLFPPIAEVLERCLPTFTDGPIVTGFPFGPSDMGSLIPLGVPATMVAKDGSLTIDFDLSDNGKR